MTYISWLSSILYIVVGGSENGNGNRDVAKMGMRMRYRIGNRIGNENEV